MHETIQYDVFISYSFKDEKWVSEFAQQLTNCGLTPFIFEKAIKIGESIPRKLNIVLDECNYIILIMTPDWVDSEWSKSEAYSSLFDDPNNVKKRVIPILLKDCRIPTILKVLKYLDFRDNEKFSDNFNFLKFEFLDLLQFKFNKKIHSLQCEQILNQSMLPWTIQGGPSVGFIIPELFIEPKIKAIKNPFSSGLNSWLAKYKWNKNIAIIGLPGAGKSTLMKKLFINYFEFQDTFQLHYTPLFLTVRDLIEFKSLGTGNFSEYICLKWKCMSLSNSNQRFFYFIDGLDEIEESNSENIISTIKAIISIGDLLWISSRKEFFFNNLKTNLSFYTLFYDVLEIQEWNIETDSFKFAKDYSLKYNKPELYNRLSELREKSPSINNFLKNPFELTLIIYLLTKSENVAEKVFDSTYNLYKSFYENWLEKEQHKGISKVSAEDIRIFHRSVAIALFRNRGNGIKLNKTNLSVLKADLTFADLKANSSFWDLLITSSNLNEDIIERFWHETLGEYILAEELIQSFCSSSTQVFLRNLKTSYYHEINLFIRQGFQQLDFSQKKLVYDKLLKTYFSEFTTELNLEIELINLNMIESSVIDESKIIENLDSVRIREQIIYYLGRLELNFYPPLLSFAVKFEKNLLLKRSAILGGILYGNEEMEKCYLDSLIPNSIEDKLNRSVQLVYRGDVQGDIHSFNDNNVFAWKETRNSIINRFKKSNSRDIALRWWDLRTLFCFFESRKWNDKITKSEFIILKECICNSNLYSKKRNNLVAREKSRLLISIKKNKCVV